MRKEEVFKEAIKQWGMDAQCSVAIEEMAELIKELSKLKRADYQLTEKTLIPLTEEIADVRLMLDQLVYMFRIDISEIYERKLNNVAGRLGIK